MTESIRDERWWVDAERDPIHLIAVDWFTRIQDPEVSLEDTLAWQNWIKADPRHAQAFSRIEEVSLSLRHVSAPPQRGRWGWARDRYDASVPLADWERPTRSRTTLAIAASVAFAVTGVLAWAALKSNWVPFGPSADVLTTAVGENRSASLADGSKITLGGDTTVEVVLSKNERSIALNHGEAFFTVAKDPSRPFRVHAGTATVVAVGTEFNVRRDSDRAVVAVIEGRVIVEPEFHIVPVALLREFKPKLRPVHVSAGQQTTAGSSGIEDATKVEDAGEPTSWQSGRLAFRLQPLRYVVEDVNRYAPKRIVIEDESIGSLIITGTVTREGVARWTDSLERAFGLEAVEERDRILLRQR